MKYLKAIPLMLYPYAYLIVIFLLPTLWDFAGDQYSGKVIPVLFIGCQVLAIVSAVYPFFMVGQEKYNASDMVKLNLFVKGLQIPAYLFHFLLGMAGLMLSVWGIGFILFAALIDLLTILFSGLHACAAVYALKKSGAVSMKKAWLLGICSFLYCIDLMVAVYMVLTVHRGVPVNTDF